MAANTRWRRFTAAWIEGACRHAAWIVPAAVLAAALAVWYIASNLGVETDRERMLSDDLPFKRTEQRYKELFPQFRDNLVLVVDGSTPEDARAGALALARRLEARPDLFRAVYLPRADAFLEEHALLYLAPERLEDLADHLARIQPFLGRLRGDESLRGLFTLLEQALEADLPGTGIDLTRPVARMATAIERTRRSEADRLSWQELMADEEPTADMRRQFVLVQPVLDYGRLFAARPAIDAVRAAAAAILPAEAADLRVRITGGLAMAQEELSTVVRGAQWFGLVVLLAVGGLLWWCFGRMRLVASALLTLIVGLIFTAAFATVAIGHLNLISVAFGILYIGLGIDYAIHLGLRYREAIQHGAEHTAAISKAAQDVGGSLVLCSLSTALGFYAFVPTAYAGVSELGLIAGTGMFISLFLNLTLLPALLSLRPLVRREDVTARVGPARRFLTELPLRHRRGVLAGAGVLAVVGLVLLPRVEFDANPLNLRNPEDEAVATFRDLLRTSATPPWSLTLLAAGADDAARLAAALKALPQTDSVVTLDSFVPSAQEEKLAILEDTALALSLDVPAGDGAREPSPDELRASLEGLKEAAAAYLARPRGGTDPVTVTALRDALAALPSPVPAAFTTSLSAALLATLPANLERLRRGLGAEGFARDQIPARIASRWIASDGTWRVEAFAANDLDDADEREAFVAAVRGVSADATGSPVTMTEAARAIVSAFRQALIVALLATAMVLFLLIRDLRDVALVLTPLLLAGLVTCACMVLLGIAFNFANVVALPLLLGIGVDSGIHMVDRARHGLRGAPEVNPLHTSTARGVIFSTATTACSFGQLALSPHRGTSSMGLLLTIGMACTLLATLVVIPALLGGRGTAARARSVA